MSRENVEDYRRSSDAWTRGDREAWLSDIPPDWEFRATGVFSGCRASIAVAPVRSGSGAICAGRGRSSRSTSNGSRTSETSSLPSSRSRVTGRDGIEASRRSAHVVTYRDGVGVATDNYESWEAALKAVGLEE